MCPLSFDLPQPVGATGVPEWTGSVFRIGDRTSRVLAFGAGASGWTDHLTELHEETVGGDHFIDLASRAHALAELRRWLGQSRPSIIEIGCSGGHFLRDLAVTMPDAEIIGADYTLGTLDQLGQRLSGVPLLQFDLIQCPLPSASFDAVVLLNVLEHIERDELALAQLSRILRPGGILIAEVPAGPNLYDSYDAHLMHFRRYKMQPLIGLMERSGLAVVERNHLGFILYPPFWLTKKMNRLRGSSSELDRERGVKKSISRTKKASGVGNLIMSIEERLRRHAYLPIGIRCLVTARKM
jgi:SAM-dependent methyltransferase